MVGFINAHGIPYYSDGYEIKTGGCCRPATAVIGRTKKMAENNFLVESDRMNRTDRMESYECGFMSRKNPVYLVNPVLSLFGK